MKHGRGFSLLELLIGLALLSLIMILLLAGFRLATKTWDAVDSTLETELTASLSRNAIFRLVEGIAPMRMQRQEGRPIAILGEPGRLIAVTTGARIDDGLRVFELAQVGGTTPGRVALGFRHAAFRYDTDSIDSVLQAAAPPHILLNDLDRLEFAFFGREKRDQGPVWSSAWSNGEEFPNLVRITTIDHGQQTELNVPIHAVAGKCELDLSFKLRCR